MADFWEKVIFDRNGRVKIYKSYKSYDRFNNGISDGVKIQVCNFNEIIVKFVVNENYNDFAYNRI